MDIHPKLICEDYDRNGVKTYYDDDGNNNYCCKVLEVYSYYQGEKGGEVDKGTKLRFIQYVNNGSDVDNDNHDDNGNNGNNPVYHCLPGIVPVDAKFDETCMSAYCDHWVSNGELLL